MAVPEFTGEYTPDGRPLYRTEDGEVFAPEDEETEEALESGDYQEEEYEYEYE